ncbi:hypothetical protein [Haliea sp.]|tara:strand:- start:27264 stop:27485 length:222 start_codon:yes stop_codon:yes gene_type:complete
MEATSASLLTFGIAALLVSWVLLLIQSWKEDYAWGLCTLILPPFAYLYGLFRLDKAGQAILLALIGVILIWMA